MVSLFFNVFVGLIRCRGHFFLLLLLLLFLGTSLALSPIRTQKRTWNLRQQQNGMSLVTLLSPALSSSSSLLAKPRESRGFLDDDDDSNHEREHDDIGRQRSTDRPTETLLGTKPPEMIPSTPKIVVLGATGRVGRLVVRQLLEMESMDMTVVAFVRDYDKAIRVLYDDILVVNANSKKGSSSGPKLEIVQGDLVPSEELPGFAIEDSEEEQEWERKAMSAATFYKNEKEDYDNRESLPDINESLEDALKGCTTVISCLGAVRPTNIWTDILARPFWRILRADVSGWCQDRRHPFYVHYASTRKTLGFVEREQSRREAAVMALSTGEDSEEGSEANSSSHKSPTVPKIRFIRISDLCVGEKPWNFVPLVTNIVQSVIFRYYEMAEQLLERSDKVETVILRPGDLVDEERDLETTSLQVSHTGSVPLPARVGRDDVAALAVACAMFQSPQEGDDELMTSTDPEVGMSSTKISSPPFHYTLACRWVGQQLDPFPAQGLKADGAEDASTALRRTLQTIQKNERRQRKAAHDPSLASTALRIRNKLALQRKNHRRRRRQQPHGLCTAIPIYIVLALFSRTLLVSMIKSVPGGSVFLSQLSEQCRLGVSALLGTFLRLLPFATQRNKYISF